MKKEETKIQDKIITFCERRNECVFVTNTTGSIKKVGFGKSSKIILVKNKKTKGFSDLIWLRKGVTYYIEVKTEDGVWGIDQKAFCKKVSNAGCIYFLCRSLDAFIDFYKTIVV